MSDNLLNNRYLSFNDVLSLDETFLGDISLIFLINVTSGMILGWVISNTATKSKSSNLTSDDLIELIDDLIHHKKRGGYPSFQALHGDKSPLYSDLGFIGLLEKYNIKFSWALGERLQNQMSETYNNVIKRHVCRIILKTLSRSEMIALNKTLPKDLARKRLDSKANDSKFREYFFKSNTVKSQIFMAIPEAVDISNNSKHTLFSRCSRRDIEKEIRNAKKPSLRSRNLELSARGTPEGDDFISKVMNNLARNGSMVPQKPIVIPEILPGNKNQTSESFIDAIRQANRDTNVEIINTIIKAVQVLGSQNDAQLKSLNKKNLELQEKLDYLVDQAHIAEMEKEAADEKRRKRALAIRDRKRDAIKEIHFDAARELAKNRNMYIEARSRCALTLLFITGLRSSELRFITIDLLTELFQNGTMGVDRNKKGMKSKPATLTVHGRKTLAKSSEDFQFILNHKKDNSTYFFTSLNRDIPLARETIQKDLNKILDQLKTQYPGLYFRTHSFRAGYITRLWRNGFDINKIRQAIGHKSISVTQGYIEDMDEAELQNELSNLEEDPELEGKCRGGMEGS